MDEEKIKQLSQILSECEYYEWCIIKDAIEKKYSQVLSSSKIDNTQELTEFMLSCFE